MFANKLVLITIAVLAFNSARAQTATADITEIKKTGKELYLPRKVYRIPENNDYSNSESDYSFKRMIEGENIVIFWHK